MSVAGPVIELATAAVFQDLSKTARTAMGGETPVPFHPDLRPKKVDTFVKNFLKRKGANFNTAMDRRQLNMAGRMLDPIGPLSQLWKTAILAEEKATGIDPALERNISLSYSYELVLDWQRIALCFSRSKKGPIAQCFARLLGPSR